MIVIFSAHSEVIHKGTVVHKGCGGEKLSLKVGLHVRVNFCESYREHLATTFRCESKSWLAGSLRSLLRAPEL